MTIHTENQLARLAAVLASVDGVDSTLTVGAFDGYVAGLLVCPEKVPAWEWLVPVWGVDPAFEHPDGADAALDALQGHYDRVARSLRSDPAAYAPVFDMGTHSGKVSWKSWVEGFGVAMALRPLSWDLIGGDDDAASAALSLLVALSAVLRGESGLSMEAARRLDRQAPGIIRALVGDLNAWILSRRRPTA
ncbi:MAG: UPF0149 family protein [Rhodospirillaceae bacterium]|nr:UPF0149 family protein [Rhodospirillaceae bacterium]MDE0360698.1 UPF0149 family protein [Rhodospirillaceae bacterium]